MKKIIAILLFTVSLIASSAYADTFDDAIKEYSDGNYDQVHKLLMPIALEGYAPAQLVIGGMYSEGKGVAKNYVEAVKWYKLSATQGNAGAQVNLAQMYENGNGVLQDYVEAVKWNRLAAEQGYVQAQYNLGLMYALGQGVSQNNVKAHVWWNLAAISGNKDAVKSRDIVVNIMTKPQLAEAQKLARECLARNYKGC